MTATGITVTATGTIVAAEDMARADSTVGAERAPTAAVSAAVVSTARCHPC
jgi:hypothetical protein